MTESRASSPTTAPSLAWRLLTSPSGVTPDLLGFENFGNVRYANIGAKAPESGRKRSGAEAFVC